METKNWNPGPKVTRHPLCIPDQAVQENRLAVSKGFSLRPHETPGSDLFYCSFHKGSRTVWSNPSGGYHTADILENGFKGGQPFATLEEALDRPLLTDKERAKLAEDAFK